MPDNKNEVTTNELLEFMQRNMATKVDLHELEQRMATKTDLHELEERMDKKFDNLDLKFGKFKHEMFDHMDEKMTDLRGDLVVLMRKEDMKMVRLCEMLKEKDILADKEIQEILRMEPFPKLAL